MPTTTDPRPARVLRLRGAVLTGATGLLAAAVLAACGGGSAVSTAAGTAGGPKTVSATGRAAAPGQNGQGGPGGSGDGDRGAEFAKIRDCLTAAGISLPTPTFRGGTPPQGGGTGAPRSGGFGPGGGITKGPDGKYTAPDGDVYTAMPTPGADGRGPAGPGGDGFRQIFSDPKVQAALKACGLTVPTGRPDGARPSATPTA